MLTRKPIEYAKVGRLQRSASGMECENTPVFSGAQ